MGLGYSGTNIFPQKTEGMIKPDSGIDFRNKQLDEVSFLWPYWPPLNMICKIGSETGFGFESRHKPLFLVIREMLNPEDPGNNQVKVAADFFADAFRTTRQTGLAAGLVDNDNHGL
jgi:hypothetical protein